MKDSGLVVYRPDFGQGTVAHAHLAKATAQILRWYPNIDAYYIVFWGKDYWNSRHYFPEHNGYPRHLLPAMIAERVREVIVTNPAIDEKLSDD